MMGKLVERREIVRLRHAHCPISSELGSPIPITE